MNRLITLSISIALVTLTPSVGLAINHGGYGTVTISPTEVEPGDVIEIDFSYTLGGIGTYLGCPWRVSLDGDGTDPTSGTLLAGGSVDYWGSETTYNISTSGVIPEDTEPGEHEIHIWSAAGTGWNYPSMLYIDPETDLPPVIQVGSSVLLVDIDIKPHRYPNYILLRSWGTVPVAILSSEDFDATTVDPATVELAGAGVAYWERFDIYLACERDVNCDGLLDLVCRIKIKEIDPDQIVDGYAFLFGSTYGGQEIMGSDEVIIIEPPF